MATSEISLRIDLPREDRLNDPIVTVLVNGEEFLPESLRGDYIGFDPRNILSEETPLLPTEPPRRVAVLRCSCGEPGCACVAPVISAEDRVIIWSDFRDFTGVYADGPLSDRDPPGGHDLGLRRIVFDTRQYRAEVERASRDRSWETQARATARMLQELLRADPGLGRQGYKLSWIVPDWDGADSFHLSLTNANGDQVVVTLTPAPGSPEERSLELAETMLETDPSEWNITFHGGQMGRLERRRLLRRLRSAPGRNVQS